MSSGQRLEKVWLRAFYDKVIGQPVERWYLLNLESQLAALTQTQRTSIRQQAVIGWLQTVLLVVVVIQSLFAGALRALPPDLRASVGFLHRIEWGVYAGILLIAVQVAFSWRSRLLLTNRFYLLAWRFGSLRIVTGVVSRRTQIGYIALIVILVAALIWVRLNGFIVQPSR